MPRMLVSAFRAIVIVSFVAVLLWAIVISAPMWLTRWRMSRLLADYHGIYLTQTTWADAGKVMTRWGKWGHYEGSCSAAECDYTIRVEDVYASWIEKLSEKNQNRIYNSHLPEFAERLGYRMSGMNVRFQILDARVVRTYSAVMVDVIDSGPPEYYRYPLIITVQTRSNLSKYRRPANGEPGVYGWGAQLDIHPDYEVSRPAGCENCMIDRIAYTPALRHELAVQLTSYNLGCLTQLHPCTTVGDLLPFGSGWHLWEDGPSNLYPVARKGSLPCGTEPRALARDAATVLEVETLSLLPTFKAYADDEPREFVKVRVLQSWKTPIPDAAGAVIQVSPFQGEDAGRYSASTEAEHLLPGQHALIFLPESGLTDFSAGKITRIIAYELDRCGVIADTPANIAAAQLGISQDIPYPHPLQNISWW